MYFLGDKVEQLSDYLARVLNTRALDVLQQRKRRLAQIPIIRDVHEHVPKARVLVTVLRYLRQKLEQSQRLRLHVFLLLQYELVYLIHQHDVCVVVLFIVYRHQDLDYHLVHSAPDQLLEIQNQVLRALALNCREDLANYLFAALKGEDCLCLLLRKHSEQRHVERMVAAILIKQLLQLRIVYLLQYNIIFRRILEADLCQLVRSKAFSDRLVLAEHDIDQLLVHQRICH